MINQPYASICMPELLSGAIENNEYHGFKEDYHVLHCLLRKYNPASVFEIGCNMGTGTNIICHALPDAKVYSLDLPTELAHISLQHPISEGKGDAVGSKCKKPFTLLRGDSLLHDFLPCEAFFIDGEHDYLHPLEESKKAFKHGPKLIVWHDSDMIDVYDAITHAHAKNGDGYNLYRVSGTRIAYAVKDAL